MSDQEYKQNHTEDEVRLNAETDQPTPPNHTEFIERNHRQVVEAPTDIERKTKYSLRFFSILGLFFLFVFLFSGLSSNLWALRVQPLSELYPLIAVWGVSLLALYIFLNRARNLFEDPHAGFDYKILDSVIEGSRGARLITAPSDSPVYYNRRFYMLCNALGTPGLDTLAKLFQNNDKARDHFDHLADQAHRGLTGSIDLKVERSGQDVWYLIVAQPIVGWSGYIHWRIDDVTDKYNARLAKDEEREKLIDFTDNAPVGFFSVDEEGRFIFANATLARWLGVDLNTLLAGLKIHSFLVAVPEDARPYDVVEGGGARQVVELKMKGPQGRIFTASISQTVVMSDDKRVRTRAVVHDISAERAMRHALKASEDRFLRFFEEAPLGIIMIDPELKIQDCNRAFVDMLGAKNSDIESKDFSSFLHSEDCAKVSSLIKEIVNTDQVETLSEVRLKPVKASSDIAGEDYVYAVVYVRHYESGNNQDSIVLHFIDTSEKKSLEEKFAQSQKMQAVGQLAGGVAHDFNNLLTAIIGFCDLLLLRHKPGDPSFQDIMQIKQNSNRASNLVRQLLAFSRQQTLRPKVQDVSDILIEVSHLVRRLLGANVELEMIHGESLGLVRVDGGQMEQVIINMAVNARDAMDGAGKLIIETAHYSNQKPKKIGGDEMAPGHWVKIAVSDTGCGIEQSNLERIFEPFFTTKDVGKGTGLGLATVYGIIRQTGGFLEVDSKLGEGTTFIVYLPVAKQLDDDNEQEALTNSEAAKPKPRDLTGTAKILLVEDEDAVRSFSERALNNKGYQVVGADCGENAIEVMAQEGAESFDLIITDVIMPNMDGPTLVKHVRKDFPKMKIIFVSGYTEEKLKEHMGENIYFLPKPFSLKQLAEKVKDVLA